MNDEIIRQNWPGIKDHIRTEYKLSNISYKTWIEGLTIARIEGNTVTIEIPSEKPFMLTYIENNYKILFKITI
ncbi:MAG: DnaA N-terminal domain-containing protein, partial [bacterium]